MKIAHLTLASMLMIGAFEAKADPVAWMDRCLVEANEEQSKPFRHNSFKSNDCVDTILNYCTFAEDQMACFNALEREFAGRSKTILAGLPEGINAGPAQQKIYENRLRGTRKVAEIMGCQTGLDAKLCAAQHALTQFILARSTATWITKFEDAE